MDDHKFGDDGLCEAYGAHEPTEGLTYTYDIETDSYSVACGSATATGIYIADYYNDGENGRHPVSVIASEAF